MWFYCSPWDTTVLRILHVCFLLALSRYDTTMPFCNAPHACTRFQRYVCSHETSSCSSSCTETCRPADRGAIGATQKGRGKALHDVLVLFLEMGWDCSCVITRRRDVLCSSRESHVLFNPFSFAAEKGQHSKSPCRALRKKQARKSSTVTRMAKQRHHED